MSRHLFTLLVMMAVVGLEAGMAQGDSLSLSLELDSVQVQASKITKPWLETAASSYVIQPLQREQQAQNSLQEFLLPAPSVFSLNANNRAQDLRISIRGFGSRAAFGVRGVKIIVDGIPETTPDGQGQLDNLNLGILQQIEVLNNGSAALYGNASGGVLNLRTLDESAFQQQDYLLRVGLSAQSFAGQQHQMTIGRKWGQTSVILHANHHQGRGYREHSAFQASQLNLRVIHHLAGEGKLEAIFNFMDSPQAQDPGGVNFETFDSLPGAARPRNVQFQAGEAIRQLKGSLRYEGKVGKRLCLNSYAFYSGREFLGRIPVGPGGVINFQRDFMGQGSSLAGDHQGKAVRWRWQLGYDASVQMDDRQRYENLDGERGDLSLDQDERFSNLGSYWISDVSFKRWVLNAALRHDFNRIAVEDRFMNNGDDTGQIRLDDFNYALGLAFRLSPAWRVFVNHSTSFETPTLNELSNNPDGSGFNPDLRPQQAQHLELGFKGFLGERGRVQLSGFYVNSQDELLPFEVDSLPGRTFFQNVGETQRLGTELYLDYQLTPKLMLIISGAWYRFTFEEYELEGESLRGNFLPGLPAFQGFAQVNWTPLAGLDVLLQNQTRGQVYTNNANTDSQSTRSVVNLSASYTVKIKSFQLKPYAGVNNLTGTQYADNIRPNAFGGRFYEAAPRQFFYAGLRFNW